LIELSRYVLQVLRKDEEFILYRGRSQDGPIPLASVADSGRGASSDLGRDSVSQSGHDSASAGLSRILLVAPALEYSRAESLKLLEHAISFKEELDPTWAVRPIAITRHWNRLVLVMEDPGGVPLDQLLGQPLDIELSLHLAISLSNGIGHLHQRGIVHKDIKPPHILVNRDTRQCWLRGFGVASRLKRERQTPEPPEFIEGTLAYMAPEQTGRMNRSIDSRSDLYSFGVTLYEMVAGNLPFSASDPMEWVHCHIAKRPIPPGERLSSVPAPLSAIIMKLLAKTAEERYQTAAGVEHDLRRCLEFLEGSGSRDPFSRSPDRTRHNAPTLQHSDTPAAGIEDENDDYKDAGQISEFPLGQHDTPDRLLIPEKLHGRAHEIDTLLASFARVAASGKPELVLVSGYSGIGKSSVVNELHRVLVQPRGLFASGKFDQYKRDIPYATLAQALQSLVRPLLGKSEAELLNWRDAFQEALGPNGQLIVDLVPELKLIIGEQPPLPDLPPQDAQGRFQLVFQRFIAVFARPEHPVVLFLDDLQWLDPATLDLIEDLLTSDLVRQSSSDPAEQKLRRTWRPDVRHLMLIGAYRDNEVSSSHPLMRKLETIRDSGAVVREIILAPLTEGDLRQLISDSLRCESGSTASLAQLVHEKTGGNPFFAIQFISALAEEGLLIFDHSAMQWSWDLARINAKGYTDNVVDLMVEKLNRLAAKTQKALELFACIGNSADDVLLETAYEGLGRDLHGDLWEAVQAGLVFRSEGGYHFFHDRVQEAAYSQIPEVARSRAHLQIGRLLAARTEAAEIESRVFEMVNQFNRGSQLITSPDERRQVAKLNLIAGNRARLSTAYASAIEYLTTGRALLTEEDWKDNYELLFGVEFRLAECELLTARLAAAERRLSMLAGRTERIEDVAAVARLRLTLYTTLDQTDRGVEMCLEYLRRGGTDWPPHPTSDQAQSEYNRIWQRLGHRSIESILDLPLMTDPDALAELDVLTEIVTPAEFTDENLLLLVICRMVNLSLEHGNSDGSCFAYVYLGMIAGERFGNYAVGVRFGQLGYDLVEKRGLRRFQARTYLSLADLVIPWTKHVRTARDLIRRAFENADLIGDLTFAAYSCFSLNANLLATGDSLVETHREAEISLEFAQRTRFGLVIDTVTAQFYLIRTLRGLTAKFGCFNDARFDELDFERHLSDDRSLAFAECRYWIRKLQARFFSADYSTAIEASANAQKLLWTSRFTLFEGAEYDFYSALSYTAIWDSTPANERQRHLKEVTAHYRQLEVLAANCPENFETRVALVGAEIARIEGRDLDAMRLYEQAIRCARKNDFIQIEGVANEVAARFYLARGFERIAYAYLSEARHCYLRWAAAGKVRQLDQLYPQLREEEPAAVPGGSIGASVEQLDLATVIKVSQTVSGETVLEKLIDTLMRMAIEHAGAGRGVLILSRGAEQRIEAEAVTGGDTIIVRLRDAPAPNASAAAGGDGLMAQVEVPESIVHYVVRTRESVILDDALVQNQFSTDEYIRQEHARSVLCLPLIKQTKLTGVLYLENKLTPHVFTPKRIAVLKLLASQAATCLENTRLYHDLEEREAKIRRLVDANIIGIFIWKIRGEIIEANEAFLRIVGYSREDLMSGRLRWTDLTPADWRDRDERAIAELETTGRIQPYEKEFFRKDGVRVPVLKGSTFYEGSENEGVAFVLDLSELKRAEEALRRSEAYLAEAQKLSNTGSFGWNLSSGKIYWSQETFRIFGIDSATEPTLERVVDRTHPEDRALVQVVIDRVLQDRRNFDLEHRLLMPDGSVKYLRVVGRLSKEDEAGDYEFVGAVTDITERKRAEEALQRAQTELAHVSRVMTVGQLSASIAHEMNQPLSAIVTNANAGIRWLAGDSPDLQEANQAIKRIIRDGQRASAVVGRMHALFKKAPTTKEPLDINEVIQEVLSLSQGEIKSHGISLRTRLANDLPMVMGDRIQFQQVILNLVLNAIQAMTETTEGRREMEVSSEKVLAKRGGYKPESQEQTSLADVEWSHVLITVQDSGPGLDAELVTRLFEAFYTTKPQGLGIGLTISRSIIEAHGGKLWAKTNASPGATFQFTLPI
jgi:PAS domain S-box-containing protein